MGLTSASTVQHAAEIFERQKPTSEEQASVALAELTSIEPLVKGKLAEFLGDEFKLTRVSASELLQRSESVGFVDAEGQDSDRLYFNGNLFRRDSVEKAKKVLDSLRDHERLKVSEFDSLLDRSGCASVAEAEQILGGALFDKLKAAGMYDMNIVANPSGETAFITKPSAFHKFNDPLVDDAFDHAKALVAALYYGMTQSNAGRGRIGMISALLRKLISGGAVGPATAIGEDYRVLETKGVLSVQKAPGYGYNMRLLKRDVGEMALRVLTTGDAASLNVIDRPLPGTMSGYTGPEKARSAFRRKQVSESKRLTNDVLHSLRTAGQFS
ncbi:hypothetical protein [Bradyrhizobium sp. SSUT77]|uniref:hypothetical protein n=1 Tax=Bradyrhizobium sp. SSUT77 TaxID=3040603 RepID=UPI00244B79F0|nr:hypothetical protein [Bradyrhizobium sp. SSUT77]MDH2340994.1 hypothetical protein [Bradyrhizobium sp. SSUT77]